MRQRSMAMPLPCANWSFVPLASGPGIAYVAMARSGSGSLRAVLANLYGMDRPAFPHDHSCTLRGLASRHPDARRVIVPLRLLHDRIVSGFTRSQRRQCRPPAYKPACVPPLREAPERFVKHIARFAPGSALPTFMKPANAYVNLNLSSKNRHIDVRFVCTCQLRTHVARALEVWNVPGADAAWEGVENRHVTVNATLPPLSDEAIAYLRMRFPMDYALVEHNGCGERDCADTPKEGAALARLNSRSGSA